MGFLDFANASLGMTRKKWGSFDYAQDDTEKITKEPSGNLLAVAAPPLGMTAGRTRGAGLSPLTTSVPHTSNRLHTKKHVKTIYHTSTNSYYFLQ